MPLSALGLTPETNILGALFTSQPSETFAPGRRVLGRRRLEACVSHARRLPAPLSDPARRAAAGHGIPVRGRGVRDLVPGVYLYTAEAVTPVRLRRLSRKRLDEIDAASSDALHQQIMFKIYEEMSAAQHLIIVLGQLSGGGASPTFSSRPLTRRGWTGAGRSRSTFP